MRKLLLILIPTLVFAQNVPMPIPGTGACRISAVSGATPARVTVLSIAACGIQATDGADVDTDPDNRIRIMGARSSNTATSAYMNINTHPTNSTDENGQCSIALNISGNQFDLYRCDGTTAITASSSWAAGGFIYRVRLMPLKSWPNYLLDGPSGPVTTGLQSTATGTGWADPARHPWVATSAVVDTYIAATPANGKDENMVHTARSALRWYGQGKPGSSTSKDAALTGVRNIRQYLGTMACDETATGYQAGCGQPASGIMDYLSAHFGVPNALLAVHLMWEELTTPEKTEQLNYWLNDLPQNQGGHNFPGSSLTKPTFKTGTGPIGYTGGTTTITGDGSVNFSTSYTVGDYVITACNSAYLCENFARQYRITAIPSSTTLTVDKALEGTRSGVYGRVGSAWVQTEHGYLWFSKHYDQGDLCGGNVFQGGAVFGCPDYPPAGGQGTGGIGNHNISRLTMQLAIGAAFASFDIRARWLMADAAGAFYHIQYPAMLGEFSAITNQATVGYAPLRGNFAPLFSLGIMKNSVSDAVEYAHSEYIDAVAQWNLAAQIPGPGTSMDKIIMSQDDGSENNTETPFNLAPSFPIMLFWPTSTYAGALKANNEASRAWVSTTNFNGPYGTGLSQTTAYLGIGPQSRPPR
jgi:hypothetical protein